MQTLSLNFQVMSYHQPFEILCPKSIVGFFHTCLQHVEHEHEHDHVYFENDVALTTLRHNFLYPGNVLIALDLTGNVISLEY